MIGWHTNIGRVLTRELEVLATLKGGAKVLPCLEGVTQNFQTRKVIKRPHLILNPSCISVGSKSIDQFILLICMQ